MTAILPEPPDHPERLRAARRRAAYEIGDASWADTILAAYLDPSASERSLAEQLEVGQ